MPQPFITAPTGLPTGKLLLASCRSGTPLARATCARYATLADEAGDPASPVTLYDIDRQFSDAETTVRLDVDVSGCDVFLFQALHDPTSARSIDQNYMAFLIAVRTFREWGANRITGVLPYLAYARQDKPTRYYREPTSIKLLADMCAAAGLDRLVMWHPHTRQLRGFYGKTPVHTLQPESLFADIFRRFAGHEDVIVVAPDAGASKFVTHFGRTADLNSAIASKFRPRPEEANVTEIIGDFSGKRTALVLDDMISSGGTIEALARKLAEKGIEEMHLGISHNLCMDSAYERLQHLHNDGILRDMVVTNSIPQTEAFRALSFIEISDLSDRLARVVNRIHFNRDLDQLSY
jgi:ribose-phosphate pyrophosphokinase